MDIEIIQGFLNQADQNARSRAFQYFEQMKTSENGWQLCINCLNCNEEKLNEPVKFFCLQVLADFVKTRYQSADAAQQQMVRDFIKHWIQIQSSSDIPENSAILNKAAQVICMVFLIDYPLRWPTFFKDLLQYVNIGSTACDIYLRILLSINSEIADREISRTQKELDLFTLIKDTMREDCVNNLVNSWYHILITYQDSNAAVTCVCLEVIGSYIAWIDIGLIANDKFVSVFIRFLNLPFLREATCDCIHQIINKGMEPVAKIKLVDSFLAVLDQASALNLSENEKDEEFIVKVANLVNEMGSAVLNSWMKLLKLRNPEGLALATASISNKVALLLKFLNSEYEEVSQSVIEFAREYLQFLKHQANIGAYGPADVSTVEAMLCILINQYKYDESANFICEGEDEALFLEYRKSLKVLFDNLILLDTPNTFNRTSDMIISTLNQWRNLPFQDVEVAITFLYLLGEAIPASQIFGATADKKNAMTDMIRLLVTCGVSSHGHVAVTVQFFETVVRFEKFFAQEPQYILEVLIAFMDERGLRNKNSHVRSRTSYLLSRFIKNLKSHIHAYTEEILRQLQDLLVLSPPENGITESLLSSDDQLYLYETAALLIVSGHFDSKQKKALLKNLLSPVAKKFETLLQKLPVVTDEQQRKAIAKCMSHAIAVTSRTSKAFSNQQTIKSCECEDVYLEALHVFLGALNLPYEQMVIQSAVRQYLHRMVVCLEMEVLPYFPIAAEQLLKSSDYRSVQEFIPLINQIISKFKKHVIPFLQQIFVPLVSVIFSTLAAPFDENDQTALSDRQLLQRSYFLFIAAIVTNNIIEVIASQEVQCFEQVLMTVIQGAVDFPDPVAQKTCFGILKKMVETWGGSNDVPGFVEFIYNHIVPSCFMAPLKETFDLNDAQTILALSESALCLKMVLNKRGDEFVSYLQSQYLPTLNISPEQIQEYCQALKSDAKAFKNYLKFFFQKTRT